MKKIFLSIFLSTTLFVNFANIFAQEDRYLLERINEFDSLQISYPFACVFSLSFDAQPYDNIKIEIFKNDNYQRIISWNFNNLNNGKYLFVWLSVTSKLLGKYVAMLYLNDSLKTKNIFTVN